ncbi:MAG: hypothetical protein WDA42_01115 [Candidatus Bathyarchaeia archaeon]
MQPRQSVSYIPATAHDGSKYVIRNNYNLIIRVTTTIDGSIVTQALPVTCTAS